MEEVILKEYLNFLLNKFQESKKNTIVQQQSLEVKNSLQKALDCYMQLVGPVITNLYLQTSHTMEIKIQKSMSHLLERVYALIQEDWILNRHLQ